MKMKNLKMKHKLLISFAIIICLALCIAVAGFSGMKALDDRIQVLMNTTLPNTERVWEIRRNLRSESSWLQMALYRHRPCQAQRISGGSTKGIDPKQNTASGIQGNQQR